MWLADKNMPDRTNRRRMVTACALSLVTLLAACQVRPLYDNSAGGATLTNRATGQSIALNDISIKPVHDRISLVVRNQLIFLMNGGKEPGNATRYSVTLGINSNTSSAAYVQIANEDEPTAGTVTIHGSYEIFDAVEKKQVKRGSRQVSSSYDVPRQRFAALRAERNAQDRAARELAEMLRLAIAQDLSGDANFRPAETTEMPSVTRAPGQQRNTLFQN